MGGSTNGMVHVFLDLICPSLGVIMATLMFGAPIVDLRRALVAGRLGNLNPLPWAVMTGNCLGWVVYGYYQHRDPFIIAANLPGLVLSLWLNSGASKLQYQELLVEKHRNSTLHRQSTEEAWDASPAPAEDEDEHVNGDASRHDTADNPDASTIAEQLVTVPQERALLRILCAWCIVLVWVGWFDRRHAAVTVGLVVNVNLIFFYGAPLQTIRRVLQCGHSASIHRPTLYMSFCNTTFWCLYGLAQWDFVIIVPNAMGLSLSVAQAVLCAFYPNQQDPESAGEHEALPTSEDVE